MIAFTTQHGGIEVPERTSDCPEPNTFKKISHKTQRNAHDEGKDKRLNWP